MSRMSAAFLAAVQGVRNPIIVPVVSIHWPTASGGTRFYSSEPFQYFEPRIVDGGIGDVTVAIDEGPSDLGFQTVEVSLIDTDGAITAILNGRSDPRRSVVTIQWASPDLAPSDWFSLFSGVVDSWSWSSGVATLTCKTDDTALQSFAPKVSLTPGVIPGLVNTARGLYAPILYGIWDDQNLDGHGSIACPNVTLDATNGYQYLVAHGVMNAVPRVYKNGTLQTLTTHYTLTYPTWGGAQFTIIKFVTATVATDTVAADVEGYTATGAIGGGLISTSTAQIKHFLSNFGWGDWRAGAWLGDSTNVDTSAFSTAETFISNYGSEGSLYLGGSTQQVRVVDVFNSWLRSWPSLRPRWSNTGKLGVVPISHVSGAYTSSPWVQQERDELSPLQYSSTTTRITSRVSLSYLPGQRAGKLWQSLDLQDLKLWTTEKITQSISLENSAARFQ